MRSNVMKITSYQALALLVSFIVGGGFLSVPRAGVKVMKDGAWAPILALGVANLISLYLLAGVLQKYSSRSVIEFSELLFGRFFGKAIPLILLLFSLLVIPVIVSVLHDLTSNTLLPATPKWFIAGTFILAAVYLVDKGLGVMARMLELLFPVGLLAVFTVVFVARTNIDWLHLYPADISVQKTAVEGLSEISFAYAGGIYLLILFPYLVRPQNARKVGVWAILIPMIIYLAVTVAAVGILGANEIERLTWPSLEIAKATDIEVAFIHRLDIIFVVLWLLALFTTAVGVIFVSAYVILSWFKINQSYVTYGIGAAALIATLLPNTSKQIKQYSTAFGLATIFINLGLPLLIWIASLWREPPHQEAQQQNGGDSTEANGNS